MVPLKEIIILFIKHQMQSQRPKGEDKFWDTHYQAEIIDIIH